VLKSTTGIRAFDNIAAGGLPSGRTTLLTGGAGSGKTVFALQALVHAARDCGEPGILVAFKEAPDTLLTYAQSFQWQLSEVPPQLLSFIDARPNLDIERIGAFDVGAMLPMLQAEVQATGAKLIVFDAIDILLAQISDPDATRREIYRLQNGLSEAGLTAIITAKTSMCGAFVAAACARGERAIFVSFLSKGDEIIRNLRSMAIDLEPYIASGLLRMVSRRAFDGSAEAHLLSIRSIASDHNATCIVTDPLSVLSKSGNRGTTPGMCERLIDWAKTEGRTVLCTSLLDNTEDPTEAAPLQISTIADTWSHLTNEARGGERNRTLSIIKSRGTGHSNQVRELVMLDDGLRLRNIFLGRGKIQMGSERLESEREEHLRLVQRTAEDAIGASRREAETVHLQSQIVLLQGELRRKVAEDQAMRCRPASLAHEENATKYHLRSIRGNSTNSGGTDNCLD